MSKIINIIDEQLEYPNDYSVVPSARGSNINTILLESGKNNLDVATVIDRTLLHEIQKNGVYNILTWHSTLNQVDYYTCELDGLIDFGIFQGLKIKVEIDKVNDYDHPKLKLNGIDYALIYKANTEFQPILAKMLTEKQVYNMTFNGAQFVVENSTLPATKDSSGIMSITDVRKEIGEITGYPFSQDFGTTLTTATAGNLYIYDTGTSKTAYLCINNTSSPTGILSPNSNFIEFTIAVLGTKADLLFDGNLVLGTQASPTALITNLNLYKYKFICIVNYMGNVLYSNVEVIPVSYITRGLQYHTSNWSDQSMSYYYRPVDKSFLGFKRNSLGTVSYILGIY